MKGSVLVIGSLLWENKTNSLNKNQGELREKWRKNLDFEIPNTIDYVFATPVKPNIAEYPNNEKIIEAILESNPRYDTYVIENYQNGIRIENDDELIEGLK